MSFPGRQFHHDRVARLHIAALDHDRHDAGFSNEVAARVTPICASPSTPRPVTRRIINSLGLLNVWFLQRLTAVTMAGMVTPDLRTWPFATGGPPTGINVVDCLIEMKELCRY